MSRGDADEQSTVRAVNQSGAGGARTSRRSDSEDGGMLVYDDFAVTNDPTSGIPGRPSLRAELQRRKLLWVTAAVVGLLLGIGLYKEMPPPYKATALVHIATIPGVQPTDEILTEIAVAQSRKVALAAMDTLGLQKDPKSVQSFMGRETVTTPSAQFVQFTVKASSAEDAVTNATALVTAFLQVRNNGLTSSLTNTINALDVTIKQQQQKLARLSAQVAVVEAQPASTEQAAKLASLKAQQSQVAGRLKALGGAVKSYAAATRVSNEQVINGSDPFGPTNAVPRSKIKYPALYAAGGLFAGLAIGMGWVIASALISTRPRRRYDIARALGAPVRLSVGRIRVNKLMARRAPESAGGRRVQQIATHLHGAIRRDHGRESLAVVAADEPLVPALAIISAALACIRQGKRVMLADLTDGAAAGRILGCRGPGMYRQVAGQQNLTVAIPEDSITPPTGPVRLSSTAVSLASADPELDHAYHSADVLLTLLTIDPGLGADHLSSWASDAVVVLTVGKRSATKIRTTADLIRLSGTTLASAVIVGADKFDESLGVLVLPTDDELAEPYEVPVERQVRDAQIAQQNGSPARGRAKSEPTEGSQVGREAIDRPRVATERRAEVRSEAKSDSRPAAWPEVKSPDVKPASKAETTMPDIRYKAPDTQPRPRVDLRKEAEQPHPEVPSEPETVTQPQSTRPENGPSPETRPYAEANENGLGSQGSRSSAWRR
jgi:capsular polysaccharide biosynthesis protein